MPLYSHTEDESPALSSLILAELDPRWCRQAITLAAADIDLPAGAVLVKTQNGNYVPYLAGEDDTEASAVLITGVKKSAESQPAVALRRGAVIAAQQLFFLSTVTGEQKAAALERLEALGLVSQE